MYAIKQIKICAEYPDIATQASAEFVRYTWADCTDLNLYIQVEFCTVILNDISILQNYL